MNFKKLKILNLSSNMISNINILEKMNFKKLNVLDLSYNYIKEKDKDNYSLLTNLKFKIINLKIKL